jgi:hypothetical protein
MVGMRLSALRLPLFAESESIFATRRGGGQSSGASAWRERVRLRVIADASAAIRAARAGIWIASSLLLLAMTIII